VGDIGVAEFTSNGVRRFTAASAAKGISWQLGEAIWTQAFVRIVATWTSYFPRRGLPR
jgi:hypothetical protein